MVATMFGHKLQPTGTVSASLFLLPITEIFFFLLREWQAKFLVFTAKFIFYIVFSAATV